MDYSFSILVKKRLVFFFLNIIILVVLLFNFINARLMNIVLEYGKYQCSNISTRLINYVVDTHISDEIKHDIVTIKEDETLDISFNTAIINSIANGVVRKLQYYFYMLEKGDLDKEILEIIGVQKYISGINKGIVYEVPLNRAFNNFLIGNLGVKIPVRYRVIGNVEGQIISSLKEYGINNALLEISLVINSNAQITIPLSSQEESVNVSVPIVMRLIQGEIPEAFYGTNLMKEVS